jgi:hypothetical protein
VISLVAAARRQAIIHHRPRHLVAIVCDLSPPPYLCAPALQVRIAAARACFGRREPPPGLTPAKRRRLPLCSRKPAAARCLQAIRVVRSPANGSDLIGAYPFGAVHHGPVSRAHGAAHHACARSQPLDLRSMAQPSLFR